MKWFGPRLKIQIGVVLVIGMCLTAVFAPLLLGLLLLTSGSLAGARQRHTASLMPNGQVLALGGDNGGSPLASATTPSASDQSSTLLPSNMRAPNQSHSTPEGTWQIP